MICMSGVGADTLPGGRAVIFRMYRSVDTLWEVLLEFFEAIRRRRTTNGPFLSKAVSAEHQRLLVEVAAMAPSHFNSQPWRFILVNDKQIIEEVARISGESMRRLMELCRSGKAHVVGFHPEGARNLNSDPYSYLRAQPGVGKLIKDAAPRKVSVLNTFGDRYSKYQLNLNGHSHNYERFEPIHGVTHITTGGGGSPLELPWSGTDSRTAFRAMHNEYLRVDVSSTGMRVDAICGPATSQDDIGCVQGSVIDSFTLGTQPPAPPPMPSTLYVAKNDPSCSNTGSGTSTPGTTGRAARIRVLRPPGSPDRSLASIRRPASSGRRPARRCR